MLSLFPCCTDNPAGNDEGNLLETIPVIDASKAKDASVDSLVESVEGEPEDKLTYETQPALAKGLDVMQPPQDMQPSAAEPALEAAVEVATETPPTKDESMISGAETLKDELPHKEQPDVGDKPAVECKDEQAVKDEPASILPKVFTKTVTIGSGILGVKFDGATVMNVTPGHQASKVGIKKGYRVLTFGEISAPEDAPAKKLSEWLQEQLKAPRPVQIQFERPVLETVFNDGELGVKFKGSKIVEVTPGLQASNAGVQAGCLLLSIGSECVPAEKTETQMVEWLQQHLKAPRPVVVKFEHPSTLL